MVTDGGFIIDRVDLACLDPLCWPRATPATRGSTCLAYAMPAAVAVVATVVKKKKEAGQTGYAPASSQPKRKERKGVLGTIAGVLNGLALQTTLYMVFVGVFQLLAMCVREPQEFLLDKAVMDRLVENHFDSSHNTFESVRRVADIWEWGNNVLWPGLFSDLGPCDPNAQVGLGTRDKVCNDDSWPDGEGSFHMDGATPYTVGELVQLMDKFDWTEGITIRQARAVEGPCPGLQQLGACFPDMSENSPGNSTSYGYNYSQPSQPLYHPFTYMTAEQLGGNPEGMTSAAIPSMRTHTTSGFVAVVIPFFSERYLPDEQGTASEVTNYRDHYVNTTNGRRARYHCVRTSLNGLHIRQLCDPGSDGRGNGRLTGAVRAHVEVFWNELKRSHWIDSQTRVIAIFLQLKSNFVGVRMRYTLMFELTPLGAILPSYDVQTRVLDQRLFDDMGLYATIALVMVIVFCVLEVVECYDVGMENYLTDVWNVMDWTNFIIFFMVYERIVAMQQSHAVQDCSNYLCSEVGFFDDWQTMGIFRQVKTYLSLCICIQLFKILKFFAALVPKTGLATSVLRKCALDLLFFGITFLISMAAFSMMLCVQLGPVMDSYRDQIPAFIALFRALFGDFDIDEIMDNSSGYLNALLFLVYLFVAVFIMLSMFLAILAEGQVTVLGMINEEKENNPSYREFGILSHASDYMKKGLNVVSGGYLFKPPAAAVTDVSLEPAKPEGDEHNAQMEAVLKAVLGLQAEMSQLRDEMREKLGKQGTSERRLSKGPSIEM